MDLQRAPGKTQTYKGNMQKVEAGTGRNIEALSDHAETQLGKPKPTWN